MTPPLPACKLGELAEALFIAAATARGLTASRPFGHDARFDVIIESGGRLFRVQVKSTGCLCARRYTVSNYSGLRRRAYDKSATDFLAAYVFPEKAWYIIPVEAVAGLARIHLYPHRPSHGRFEPFREAWHLLLQHRSPPGSPPFRPFLAKGGTRGALDSSELSVPNNLSPSVYLRRKLSSVSSVPSVVDPFAPGQNPETPEEPTGNPGGQTGHSSARRGRVPAPKMYS